MVADPAIERFARSVRRRSLENQHALLLVARAGLLAPAVAILRQEVDSLIRVIYLLAQHRPYRAVLIAAALAGERWRRADGRAPVTDRDMVELASRLFGWTQSVYKFGCAFVHLSRLHDYDPLDVLALLPAAERQDMLDHLRHYHGGPQADRPDLAEFLQLLPRTLEKIAGNLDYYLEKLESDEDVPAAEI